VVKRTAKRKSRAISFGGKLLEKIKAEKQKLQSARNQARSKRNKKQ